MQIFSLVVLTGLFIASLAQLPTTLELVPDPSYSSSPPDGPVLLCRTQKYIQSAATNLSNILDSAEQGKVIDG